MLDRPDVSRDERRLRIGVRDLRQLGPGQTIWDTAVIGFGARRQRSAAISFVVHYRTQQGRRRLLTIGRFASPWTPEAARDEARRILGIVAAGGDPLGEREARRSTALTVSELCDQWLADSLAGRLLTRRRRAKSAKTVETDRSRIEAHVKPILGNLPVASITRADVERLMHAVQDGATSRRVKIDKPHALSNVRGGTGAASRTIAMLGAMMNHAVKLGLRPDNPVAGVVRPADGRRDRRLDEVEFGMLGAGLREAEATGSYATMLAAIRFMAVTGWRRGEVLGLRWVEVDLGRRTARLSETKTGPSMRPLSQIACQIVGQQVRAGELVFPAVGGMIASGGFVRVWDRAVHRLGRLPKDVTPHVLRHSMASVAADVGYSDAVIAGLLGHAGHSVTRRYIHVADKALIAAADAVAEEIGRMMERPVRMTATTVGEVMDAKIVATT